MKKNRKIRIHRIYLHLALKKSLYFSFFSLLFYKASTIAAVPAEKNDIKGYVIDKESGEALPYANVILSGTYRGTATNTDGYFVLSAPAELCSLTVHFIGYAKHQVVIDNSKKPPKLVQSYTVTEIESKTEWNKKDIIKRKAPAEFRDDFLYISMQSAAIQGEEVTVTAEKYEMWKSSEEVAQVTFSPRQISALPSIGEPDIFRSLQLLPGISGVSDGSAGLYVRGGTPDQNLVLLDGMTVYHVDHFFGFFSAFNADAIKDVQVYKGGYPAKYGGRLSSVVELTGKTGDSNQKRLGVGLNLMSANVLGEVPLLNGMGSWIISARRSYSDLIGSPMYNKLFDFLSDTEPETPQGFGGPGGRGVQQEEVRPDFYFYDLNSKLSLLPTSRDILALSFYSGRDNMHDLQEMGNLRFGGGETTGTRGRDETTDWGNTGISLKWSHRWHDRFNSNFLLARSSYFSDHVTNLSFSTTTEDTSDVLRGRGNFASQENNAIDDFSLRFDNDWQINNSYQLEFGIGAKNIETDYIATVSDTFNVFESQGASHQLSFHLQSKLNFFERLDISAGIRSVYYDRSASYYTEPRLSLQFTVTDRLKAKAAAGRFTQFIHRIVNEDVLEGSRDFWLVADENLEPGRAGHLIVGLEYDTPGYLFSIEGYNKNMENLLEFSRRFQDRADFGGLFFFGSGVSRGVEFLAQKKYDAFNGWISYTLGDIEHKFPNLNNGEPFPASHERTHETKAVGTYSWGRWNFAATWVFASGQPYTAPEGQYNLDLLGDNTRSYYHVSDKNANHLPDYHRMDISASYKMAVKNEHGFDGELGLSIFNLYNHNNVWYRKYDLEVSPIVITDVSMLGITPTLYVKVKF
ncbi:MAG: TonB-dependent receptor [Deferribacteres bacterium]|nr:TonB-dependent receptor [Deferribacteres bacterium]